MDLILKTPTIPLIAYSEESLNALIVIQFMPWVSRLLNLKPDQETADQLENALLVLKERCRRMGADEIKEMFEAYADGLLDVKPIQNNFNRIVLGEIINAWNKHKQTRKPTPKLAEQKPISKEELAKKNYNASVRTLTRLYEEYTATKTIPTGFVWVYEFLEQQKALKLTKEQKWEYVKAAKDSLTSDVKAFLKGAEKRHALTAIENKKNGAVIAEAQRKALADWFKDNNPNEIFKTENDA